MQRLRNLLATFGGLVLVALAVGWYLGWYNVQDAPTSQPGKRQFQVEVDTAKIDEQSKELVAGLREWLKPAKSSTGTEEEAEKVEEPSTVVPPLLRPPIPIPLGADGNQ